MENNKKLSIEQEAREYAQEICKYDDLMSNKVCYTAAVLYSSLEMAYIAGRKSRGLRWDRNGLSEGELVNVLRAVSLIDLSECTFEYIAEDGEQCINAWHGGVVVDAIIWNGNIFEMMNNDGSFSPLNPMVQGFIALDEGESHPSGKAAEERGEKEEYYPGKEYQRLFDVVNESSPNPLLSQMHDIIQVVREDFPVQAIGDKPIYPFSEKGLENMLWDYLHDLLKNQGYSTGSEESYDKLTDELKRRQNLALEILQGDKQGEDGKDKGIALLEEREVAWQQKHELLNEEIERLKGLIGLAWHQSIINCEVENGAGDAGEQYVSWQQFKTENSI